MTGHHGHTTVGLGGASVLVVALAAGAALYVGGGWRAGRRGRQWPVGRTVLFLIGVAVATAPLAGPLADRAATDFRFHMVGHVLSGMAAPLLIVSAAPVTLALRALPAEWARTLTRLLRSRPFVVLTHPVVAATLSVGGLYVLYRTGLYEASMQQPLLHLVVHAHVLLAGLLVTFSLVGPDPAPHRAGLAVRAAVLVLAVAAHNVLAKLVYADPPAGVAADQAMTAAQVMYYAGAPIEIALFVLLGREWLARDGRERSRGCGHPAQTAALDEPVGDRQ
ncbi:cytochrome c oxidase assembly protein [Pseudonocardia xinjiangensis]|uniref:cytochrome c oxidase assembly protein n=1 Tax=Pseudonocardia xinjiangensis TaxID=75289 RepID=UPI0031DF9B97